MIAFLRGRVLEKQPNRLIVDVAGVGYDVAVPLSTFYIAGEPGTEITLRIHTHVREDQIALFGFATALELAVFERMIGVSGIGPKLALGVLSGIEPRELVGAIQRSDLARLTRIPGVGKKTAERIVLELRDRLPKALEAAGAGAAEPEPEDELRSDLISALTNLGYHRQNIDKTLDRLLSADAAQRFEDALRAALKDLSRG
ncbi:MAG TPA: Holliday junction branch migration protein RuvA [Vicinamibacterales bacterium]|nr:Holliday junction branch migration protein RuvA [Vicinamibacterales bacterium]